MPPMQQGAPGNAPAKTMFGVAAPVVPRAPGQPGAPGAPQPGRPPGQPGGFAPPQPQGFGQPPQPQQPGGYGQPPQGNPYGAPQQPPPGAPGGFGAPPQQANPYGAPQQPPPGQPGGFGAPPQANPYGAPPGQPPQGNPYGAPPGQPPQGNPYGAPPPGHQPPQANPYGAPPPGQPGGFGAPPPQANPYGQPQPPPGQPGGFGAPPPQANPYGQPQTPYPSAQPGFGQPPGDMPGPLDDLARKLPGSAPGTIFGLPVAQLRDPGFQKKVLFMAGVALIASILVPFNISPTIFAWDIGGFPHFIWPIIAGGLYLLLTAAPADMRAKVPPVVLQWIPFAVAYAGLFISGMGFASFGGGGRGGGFALGGGGGLYILGYSTLVFGLLARIAKPQDQTARIIIAVGAACLIPFFFDLLRFAFNFSFFPALFIIHNLIWFLVILIGVFCIVFVVPPKKLPPALQAVDALAPMFAAVLIAWLPAQQVLIALVMLVHAKAGAGAILLLAHGLLPIVAYFGVLMMAAPAAYEEMMAMFGGNKGGGPQPPAGGGYPPPGGAPPGGGYPPQGGGYPPQGGGYPPQGGGYPPQGGGYPPQGGGGYPPQGGQGGQGGGWQ